MSKKPISAHIADRLVPATRHANEFNRTYEQLTPLLERNIATLRPLVRMLHRAAAEGDAVLSEMEAIHGYALEGQEIAAGHADEMAQLTTLMVNLDVFLQADPEMLLHVLRLADPPVLKEAAGRLTSERLVLLQQAVNEAVEEYREGRWPDEEKDEGAA